MALSDLWSRKGRGGGSIPEVSTKDLIEKYDIVSMGESQQFVVVAERDPALLRELGTASASPWTSFTRQEYNPLLQGIRGLEVYDKMRRSDGAVRGTLRAAKTPVLAANYFIEPGGTSAADLNAAAMVQENLFDWMTIGWIQTLTEALLMLDFGYYMFEKVWDFRIHNGKPIVYLRKLAPRHPMDVKEWRKDSHGGPKAVVMHAPTPGEEIVIPIEKLLVFTFDREAGNIEGISVLRTAYKHWYFKEQLYKIDAIQKERHGIGIPVIKLPIGYKKEDKLAAENLGRNIRTNERAHVVLPPNWELMMLKLEGQLVDPMKSIEHHNEMIRENILVNFLKGGAKEEDITMFLKATRFIADIVLEVVNKYLIPQMVDWNYERAKYPKLRARRIGEASDQRTMSFTIRNLIGAGAIVPDDKLEAYLRNELDLPDADPETAREVATPQGSPDGDDEDRPNGARVGPPRQAPVGRQRNTQGLPRSNAGRDASGGN